MVGQFQHVQASGGDTVPIRGGGLIWSLEKR